MFKGHEFESHQWRLEGTPTLGSLILYMILKQFILAGNVKFVDS